MKPALVIVFASILMAFTIRAGINFPDPAGGWTYVYDGDQLIVGDDGSGFTSLDGTWSHDNGSDEWDGSVIGGTLSSGGWGANAPGGAMLLDENGVKFLRLQDTGDPRSPYTAPDGSSYTDPENRKIFFGHDLSAQGATDTQIDDGVTISFRARVPTPAKTKGPLDQLYPQGQGSTPIAYPAQGDGYVTSDGGKGNFVIHQTAGGPQGAAIAFSLTVAGDKDGNGQRANFTGLTMNEFNGNKVVAAVSFGQGTGTNLVALDPTDWHEFWIVLRKDPANVGTHEAFIYVDGSPQPHPFKMTAGDSNGAADYPNTYLGMGSTATPQNCALDVDFYAVKLGVVFPPGAVETLPPQITDVTPAQHASFYTASAGITFKAATQSPNQIPISGIKLLLNGQDYSAGLKVGGTDTSRSVSFNGLVGDTIYQGQILVVDQANHASTNVLAFDTFIEGDGVVIESEDYNYESGQYKDNPAPNGYQDRVGTADVDFHDEVGTAATAYRTSDLVNIQTCDDVARTKFASANAIEYQVGGNQTNEWRNYTRSFPEGAYQVYLRAAASTPRHFKLDKVTGDRTQPDPATAPLGVFNIPKTGVSFDYVPLTDPAAKLVSPSLQGIQTVRLTVMDAAQDVQDNFLFFLKQTTEPPQLTIQRVSAKVQIGWTPAAGSLEESASVTGGWALSADQTNPQTLTPTGTKYYRVRR